MEDMVVGDMRSWVMEGIVAATLLPCIWLWGRPGAIS